MYDYKAQRWVQGEEARLLRIEQIRVEINLLETDGKRFLAFNGINSTVADALTDARLEIANLERTQS